MGAADSLGLSNSINAASKVAPAGNAVALVRPDAKSPAVASFEAELALFQQRACQRRACWRELLDSVRRAAVLTDQELEAEGRREAAELYAPDEVEHYWPEPPSLCLLIAHSTRTETEEAFASELDGFAARVAAAKAALLGELQVAKAAAQIERVR